MTHPLTSNSTTIPEGLDWFPAREGTTIRKVWRTWKVIPMAGFAILWNAFLFFWYAQALSKPNPPLMVILFPVGHVGVGIWITYSVLAALFNTTDILIAGSSVTVAIGPMPWIGNKVVPAREMTDVVVRTRERSGNWNNRTYNVMYVDRLRKERKLMTGLLESDQAEFIAQVVRSTLHLNAS